MTNIRDFILASWGEDLKLTPWQEAALKQLTSSPPERLIMPTRRFGKSWARQALACCAAGEIIAHIMSQGNTTEWAASSTARTVASGGTGVAICAPEMPISPIGTPEAAVLKLTPKTRGI